MVDRVKQDNPADYSVFNGNPAWEVLTAATAAKARNEADRVCRLEYEAGKQQNKARSASEQDSLF